jgi:hypothetical protein
MERSVRELLNMAVATALTTSHLNYSAPEFQDVSSPRGLLELLFDGLRTTM